MFRSSSENNRVFSAGLAYRSALRFYVGKCNAYHQNCNQTGLEIYGVEGAGNVKGRAPTTTTNTCRPVDLV